jgi:hypothetical protein
VIDASSFAAKHHAFWADRTPTSEHFVRRLNLEYTDRWSPPIEKPEEHIRAALVSEFAFSRFCGLADGMDAVRLDTISMAETRKRLLPLMDDLAALDAPLTIAEKNQTRRLESNLVGFFKSRAAALRTRPIFKGCGYVDASEGDVISGKCLFEIKTVDRPFRSLDIRQLVAYCALNYASGQFELDSIGIFNPRRGLWFEMKLEKVCREISGQSTQELFGSVVHGISSGDISR